MYASHVKKKQAGHSDHLFPPRSVSSPILLIRNYIIGLGCTSVFGLLVLLFCTYIAYRSADPSRLLAPLAFAAWYLSALFAGIIAIRLTNGSVLLSGLISGILLMVVCLLIGLFIHTEDITYIDKTAWFRLAAPLFSVCGAYIAKKRPKSNRGYPHRSLYKK